MDFHLDTSWCPVCDRQIDPKRFKVPVPPPPQSAPPPPPSSPLDPSPNNDPPPTTRRNKTGTIRSRGGLVHGTGRVKPNGAIKRADSPAKSSPPPQPTKPALPIKHRTVIDQGPIPLYCSDECKMADINYIYGTLSLNYDPARSSPPLPPVPHNSFTGLGVTPGEMETDSSSSSLESRCSIPSSTATTQMSPSIATLAEIYNFPPLPPPAPVVEEETTSDDTDYPHEYQSGVMMAGRLLKQTLCPERPKTNIYGQRCVEPRKPIPGWTDGSTAWRSAVYNFSAPSDLALADPTQKAKAYSSFSASPHRSRGVYSTVGESGHTPTPRGGNSAVSLPSARASEAEELYSKYSLSFSRRSDSRTSIPASPSSQSFPASSRRERSLLKPGAEGKLLVPNVKMRVHSGSSASLSSSGSWTASSYPASSRPSVKSPLSYRSHWSDEETQRSDDIATSLPEPKRQSAVEERSWSYDNLRTYPVMQLPPKKEKRIEKQVVDGNEVEVEVEVEIIRPMKRLFLFPGKETSLERR